MIENISSPLVIDNILNNIPAPVVTFGASTFAGFMTGFVLRKIFKIIVIVMGLALGLFFLGIQYMTNKGYLGNAQINWDRIGNETDVVFHSLYTQFSVHHIFSALSIPATSGFAAGLAIGLVRG